MEIATNFLFRILIEAMNSLKSANKLIIQIFAIILVIIWAIFYFFGIPSVPFHPDESTQIYMSSDVELIFNDTSELFYKNSSEKMEKQSYRLLDAPLTKYFIGLSRLLFHQKQIYQDWNWSASYEENLEAIPDPQLLTFSRFSVAIFFPFSLLLFILIIRKIVGDKKLLFVFSGILFSFNSLMLLHTRRAMAESLLIFFLLLSLYVLLILPSKKIWLSSIPIALAINAKQSLMFLVPITIILLLTKNTLGAKNLIRQIIFFFLLLFGIFYILNPVIWNQPIITGFEMVLERQELSSQQYVNINAVTPEFTITKLSERITALIGQTFVLKPAYQDVLNYADPLRSSISNYSSSPLQNGLMRNLFAGVFIFFVSLFGIFKSIKNFSIDKVVILTCSFILLLVEILIFIQIPFQRYYLPLIPFSLLFFIYGLLCLQPEILKLFLNVKSKFT